MEAVIDLATRGQETWLLRGTGHPAFIEAA